MTDNECTKRVSLVSVRQRKKAIKIKTVNYGGTAIDIPYYEGDYVVDPKNEIVVLFTKDYRMRDNVVINKIPGDHEDLPDGDNLGYGSNTSPYVNVGAADSMRI